MRVVSSGFSFFGILYGPHPTTKYCLRGQENNTSAIMKYTQKLKGWLRTLCDFAQHDVHWVQTEQEQTEKEPDEENVSLGLSLGVSVQLASLLARWQVQYQALERVSPANYEICQLGLGKEKKRGEKKENKKVPDISCPSAGLMDSQKRISHSLM